MKKTKNRFLVPLCAALFLSVSFADTTDAAVSWLSPILAVSESFDDNVFLTGSDISSDYVTALMVGLSLEPELATHEFRASYVSDFEFFANNTSQNTQNQALDAAGVLNFNDWRFELSSLFRYFENRQGSEDTARVPRTANDSDVGIIYAFNKLDVGFHYAYRRDDYRSDGSIGDFDGLPLTYQDLDSNENSGEVELAFKFWPKTDLLFSSRYGTLDYDTGKKSNSDYWDLLTGLKGQITAKGTVEGKVGYRAQNYKGFEDDFDSVIFQAALTENFTSRDRLRLAFDRSTYSTTYQQNAYFVGTMFSGTCSHDFTDRLTGKLAGAYWLNQYPVETTEGAHTGRREDRLWSAGLGLSYTLPRWGTVNLDYRYSRKASNFDGFDYSNNLVSLGMTAEF